MDLADQHLDGRLADVGVVLIHSRPIGEPFVPVQMGESHRPGNIQPRLLNPLPYLLMGGKNGIRPVPGVP